MSQVLLARLLGLAALVGAIAALSRTGIRNHPVAAFDGEAPGEWPGTLGGQYDLDGDAVPYHARNLPAGLAASLVAGVVAGLSGVGGGFLKTPAMSEIMHVPVKVAAATTTFTLGRHRVGRACSSTASRAGCRWSPVRRWWRAPWPVG